MNPNGQTTDQASTPSVEDRISALFSDQPLKPATKSAQKPALSAETGDSHDDETAAPQVDPEGENAELSEETAPQPESAEAESFEFEHDGVKYAVPKALEKALLNNRDYTQKTQSLAEQRRTVELLQEQHRIARMQTEFNESVHEQIQQLQAYDAVLKQPVDWHNLSTDEAFRKKLQLDQWKDEREAILKSVQGKHQEFTQKQQDALKDYKSKAAEAVAKKIPGWSDAVNKAIRDHAIADGYTEAELNSIVDPRQTATLWKAYQYDQLKAKATKAVTDVKTVKTTPSNPMPQHVKDKLNFRKLISKAQPHEKRKLVEARAAQIFSR